MAPFTGTSGATALIAAAAGRAAARDVPASVIEHALDVTGRAIRDGRLPGDSAIRVEAYFDSVVRRRLIRDRAGTKAIARIVVASVVEDLSESGRDGHAIWDELERGWRDRLPHDVLDEFRDRLCA